MALWCVDSARSWYYISQSSLPCMFLVRVGHRRHLQEVCKGEVKQSPCSLSETQHESGPLNSECTFCSISCSCFQSSSQVHNSATAGSLSSASPNPGSDVSVASWQEHQLLLLVTQSIAAGGLEINASSSLFLASSSGPYSLLPHAYLIPGSVPDTEEATKPRPFHFFP